MEWVDVERDLLVRMRLPESVDGRSESALGDDDLDAVLRHALLRAHLADGRIGALAREERAGAGGVPRAALVLADHTAAGGEDRFARRVPRRLRDEVDELQVGAQGAGRSTLSICARCSFPE